MRPSTLIELAGFALIAFAVYSWNASAGLAVGGAMLLLIGYATDDLSIMATAKKAIAPIWRTPRRVKKAG